MRSRLLDTDGLDCHGSVPIKFAFRSGISARLEYMRVQGETLREDGTREQDAASGREKNGINGTCIPVKLPDLRLVLNISIMIIRRLSIEVNRWLVHLLNSCTPAPSSSHT